jgi:hypothetical protein
VFALLLVVAMAAVLVAVVRSTREAGGSRDVLGILLAGYVIRVGLSPFLRDIPFFSHGGGGDCMIYEQQAEAIARAWQMSSFEYITNDTLPQLGLGATTLPANLFALVIFLNGDVTRMGCTSIVALAACLTCFNIFRLAIEMGNDRQASLRLMALILFTPGFLFYTSEMFKDGLVAFLVFALLGSSFRLARKLTVLHAIVAVSAAFALWFVRYYLIFLSLAPLAVGFAGTGKGSKLRPVAMVLGTVLVLAVLGARGSSVVDAVTQRADETFSQATSSNSRTWNALGGSGVQFDDGGSAFGALHLKLLYTVFSPFPWQLGSFGFQVGKIDAFIWYFILYRAYLASRRLWREDRQLLFMFLVFLVPTTVAYATTMANIGLILRQRLPVVLLTSLLATFSWPTGGVPVVAVKSEAQRLLERLRARRPATSLSATRVGP